MSSIEVDLLDGLARYVAAAGIGTYRETGAYQPGETAIVFDALPPDPDRVIVLSAYPVSDDPSLSDSVIGVQVRYRAGPNPLEVRGLSGLVFDLLHGAQQFPLGPVHVVLCLRNSGGPLGRDANGRWEHADNYYLTVYRPSPHRT